MSRGSKIVSVRIPSQLLEKLTQAVSKFRGNKFRLTAGIGEWIREAIVQRLNHLARSKKYKKEKLVLCDECKCHVPHHDIVAEWQDLFGKKKWRCGKCDKQMASV